MPLQVWLPLVRDLSNQGLIDATFINTAVTSNDSGKLGKCYYFNGSAYLKETSIDWTNFNTSEFSLCCWYKEPSPIASGNSQMICIGTDSGWGNIRIGLLRRTSTGYPMFSVSDGTNAVKYNCTATSFTLDTWNHIACTYKNGLMSLYINGVLDTTYTTTIVPVLNSSQHLGIGGASNGAEKLTGYLNDVRIYNHALSAKEVKELSKGLVAHYTLGDKPCDNILTNSTGYNGTTNWSGVISKATENGIPYLIAQRTNTTSTSRTFVTHTAITSLVSSWVAGDKFTISGYYRVPSSETYDVTANLFIRWGASSGTSDTGFSTPAPASVIKDTWIRFEYTYSVPSSYTSGSAVNFYLSAFSQGLSTVHWKYVKLEKGDRATNWIPSVTDNLYSILGYDEKFVYDSSGYNYHMTAYGSPTISTNTVRNSVSTHFINGQYALAQSNSNVYLPKDALTVNLWMYCTTWGNPISCTEGGGWNFESATAGIQFPCYISGVGYKVANSGIATNTLLNAWHMLTGVFDGTSVKIYIDSELKATTATGSTNGIGYAANRLVISGEAAGATPQSSTFVGEISDVRIYATPLSEEDIKALYNIPVSISNTGSVFTQGEFVEV